MPIIIYKEYEITDIYTIVWQYLPAVYIINT